MSKLARSAIETTAPSLVDALTWAKVGADQYLIHYEDGADIVADVFLVPASLQSVFDENTSGTDVINLAVAAGGPSQLGTPTVVSAVLVA